MAQNLCNDMTALKRSLEIKLENILLLKIWQLVGHLLKFKTREIIFVGGAILPMKAIAVFI